MKRLLAIALLLAACGGQASPSAAGHLGTPSPSVSSRPQPSPNPCTPAVAQLGAFTRRMATELSTLRARVVVAKFDSVETLANTRRVSASLTAYPALEQTLAACPATADLAGRIEALRASAEATLAKAASARITDAAAQRTAAVSLFKLLPEVLELAEADKKVADSLGLHVEGVQVAAGANRPIGTLPPLPTPTPPPAVSTAAAGPGISAKVVGATSIKYFAIRGDTPGELVRQMAKYAPTYCGQDALACVRLVPDYRPSYASTGACKVKGVTISLSATPYMPRWNPPKGVKPALVTWWRKVVNHIAWHEGQHIKIQKAWDTRLKSRLLGHACSSVQTIINKWVTDSQRAQHAFDASDRSWQFPAYNG